jgi:porphobilinogen synthase
MNFPAVRMRRLRRTEAIRSLVRETRREPSALI